MPDNALLTYLDQRRDAFLADLTLLSGLDCGSHDKAGVDAAGRIMRARFEEAGAAVTVHDGGTMGDSLIARWRGTGQARVLLLGHLDTVYPVGWPAAHPFTISGDVARGPGTADMKGGLLAGLYAVETLRALNLANYAELTYLCNSDEEVGSPSSKELIRRTAQGQDAVLVLEPGRANGDIVSARKGTAHLDIHVQGWAAHAGVEPEKGRSAIRELAHQIGALEALTGMRPGVTVNVGTITGGSARNVVPAEASAQVDIRAAAQSDLDAVIAAIHDLAAQTTVPDTVVTIAGAVTHPPLERTPAVARLVAWCQEAARAAGFVVSDTATGGGSDGNTTAAMGIPTLDGLGPVGGAAHSPDEYILISSIVPRIAMLAGLFSKICAATDAG